MTSVAIGDLRKVPSGFDTSLWVMGLLLILILSTVAFAVAAISRDTVQESKFGWSSVAMVVAAILVVIAFREKAGLL